MSMDDVARHNENQWVKKWFAFLKKYDATYPVNTPYEENWFKNYIEEITTYRDARVKMLETIAPELEELFGKEWRVLYKFYKPNLLVFCEWTRKEAESGKEIKRNLWNDYEFDLNGEEPKWEVRNIWDLALHLYFAKKGYFIGSEGYSYDPFLGGSWKGTKADNTRTMVHFLQILERLINKAHPDELFLLYSRRSLGEVRDDELFGFDMRKLHWHKWFRDTNTDNLYRLWFAPDLEERWRNSPEKKQQDREERMAKGCSTIFIVAILAFLFYCLIFSQIDGFNY